LKDPTLPLYDRCRKFKTGLQNKKILPIIKLKKKLELVGLQENSKFSSFHWV
jgi:hypothetical protein